MFDEAELKKLELTQRQMISFKRENARQDSFAKWITIILCVLFIAHFTICVMITYYLYIYDFIYLFGLHISLMLLVFFMGFVFIEYLFLTEADGDLINPFAVFTLILYYLSAEECWHEWKYCATNNREYMCCKTLNYIICFLTLAIFPIFAPFYSISNVLTIYYNEEFSFWINYQILSIMTGTIIPFIIICLSIKSLPFIISIFCMINIILAITYLVIATFFGFRLGHKYAEDRKYGNYLPFMLIIEFLLVLSMTFIASLMDLWGSDINDLQDILLLICFINIFIPNIPFYKSFLMYKYIKTLKCTLESEYILKEKNSSNRKDKVFAILVMIAKTSSSGINNVFGSGLSSKQQIVMQQRKFSKLSQRQKSRFIKDSFDGMNNVSNNHHILSNIFWILYTVSSSLAFISPIGWIIWISLKYESYDLVQFIFTCCIFMYYLGIVFGFVGTMKGNKLWVSRELMYYAGSFKRMNAKLDGVRIHKVQNYYDQMPIIDIVFDKFQNDIAMIILLYLLD